MPASSRATPERIKDANLRYHDAAAADYDFKWGIDFGPLGQRQVRAKLAKALGGWPSRPFGAALEIGAGTGYFSLNLLQLGLAERVVVSDISPGMLAALAGTAERLGLEVETRVSDAERVAAEDESFDLVFGHAVLHHLPNLRSALAELHRIVRPGGTIAFCGEPSRYGDLVAAVPKRGARVVAPVWRRLLGAAPRDGRRPEPSEEGRLEHVVDVHSFGPRELRRALTEAGFEDVRIRGEELLASMFGWGTRTLEGTADPDAIPYRWRTLAFRGYMALQRIDASLLEPRLPASLFYNLVLSARRPS